jgi:hypothetical protein
MIVEQYVERHGVRLVISVRNEDPDDHGKLVATAPQVREIINTIAETVAATVATGQGETTWAAHSSMPHVK